MTYTAALDSILGELKPQKQNKKTKNITSLCDSCGIKASYEAVKGSAHLNFCGHHARKNAASLIQRGFSIEPEDYTFELEQ